MNRSSPTLFVVIAAALCTACGVPHESSARLVPQDRIPEALRSVNTVPAEPAVAQEPVDLWFVRDGRLARVRHDVTTPADPADVVTELLAGPTDSERSDSMRSAIPDPAAFASVTVRGGVASVELTPTFADIPAADQLLAVAQFVLTLTDLRGIGRVGFTVGDAPAPVPLPDGGTAAATVSRDEFIALI
ncbi:MAG: GerMN domain-containing protein [Ilumatobacteraceae bacterium]